MVTGLIVHRDAISNVCREQLDAIARHGRAAGRPVRLRVYALGCQPRDSRVAVAADAAALAADAHFHESDVIHYHAGVYYPLFDSIHLAPRTARLSVTFHGITPPHLVPAAVRPQLLRAYRQAANLLLADTVVTTSRYLAGELARMGVARQRIAVVPLPAAFERLPDAALRPPPGPDLRLAYVGRLVPAKGLHDLIDAAAEVARACGGPLRVDLIGSKTFSDRIYLERLAARVTELGLNDVVRFRHDVGEAELQQLLLAADAVVIPSLHEGFCVPVIEALAAGCFVICSDAGALPETAGGLGRTYPAGDAAALARRLAEFAAARRRGECPTDGGLLPRAEWEARVAAYLPNFSRDRYHERFCAAIFDGLAEMSDEARAALLAARRQAAADLFPGAAPCRTTAVGDAVARALAG
jgi:glycosyltransferase involved in cell wall biosynthesis